MTTPVKEGPLAIPKMPFLDKGLTMGEADIAKSNQSPPNSKSDALCSCGFGHVNRALVLDLVVTVDGEHLVWDLLALGLERVVWRVGIWGGRWTVILVGAAWLKRVLRGIGRSTC